MARADIALQATVGLAISVSASGAFSAGVSATVAIAFNSTEGASLATVAAGSDVTAGTVEVSALDRSRLDAGVSALSLTVSGSVGATIGLAVAATVGKNDMDSRTAAIVDGSSLSSAGNLEVTASNQADLLAVSAGVGVSISVSGVFAIAGAATAVVASSASFRWAPVCVP